MKLSDEIESFIDLYNYPSKSRLRDWLVRVKKLEEDKERLLNTRDYHMICQDLEIQRLGKEVELLKSQLANCVHFRSEEW